MTLAKAMAKGKATAMTHL